MRFWKITAFIIRDQCNGWCKLNCVCVCVCVFIHVLYMHINTDIHNGSLSSSGRDQYDNSCITRLIVPLWWKLDNLSSIPNSCHAIICPSPICRLSHIVSPSKLYVHAMCTALVACVGTYNIVWWRFNSFISAGWDLGMQATEYKCNFPSYWVDLYTNA